MPVEVGPHQLEILAAPNSSGFRGWRLATPARTRLAAILMVYLAADT